MKNNTKGSILVTAIVIIMIIMVILGASLTIASSYYKASVNDSTKKQVYLSAKASAELLSNYVMEGNEKLIPAMVGNTIDIADIKVDDDVMTKKGYIKRIDDKTLKIVVEASFDDYVYKMQLDMVYKDLKWNTHSYCEAKDGDSLC